MVSVDTTFGVRVGFTILPGEYFEDDDVKWGFLIDLFCFSILYRAVK